MTNIYIVKGSADGTIAVFSNAVAAIECGIDYLTERGDQWTIDGNPIGSYYVADLRATGSMIIQGVTVYAEIEVFTLNSHPC